MSESQLKPQVFLEDHSILGESLLYDEDNDILYYEDIAQQLLHIVDLKKDPSGKAVRTLKLDDDVGVIGQIEGDDKHLIASAKRGPALIDLETGHLEYLAKFYPPEAEHAKRANDGCIDAKGRLWSGTMNALHGSDFGVGGYLYRFDPDGSLHKVLDEMICPNGMNFSNDNKTFYVTDSLLSNLLAYDYDLETGTISNERVLITFKEGMGLPDGAHIDSQDRIWTAMAGGGIIAVIDPGNRGAGDGKIVAQVPTQTKYLTCCSFGGKDWKDLYITSGSHPALGSPNIQQEDPIWGYLHKVTTNVAGAKRHKFKWNGKAKSYQELKPAVAKITQLGKGSAPQ